VRLCGSGISQTRCAETNTDRPLMGGSGSWTGRCRSRNRAHLGIYIGHDGGMTVRNIENDHFTRPCIERVNRIIHIDGQGCLGWRDYRRMSRGWIDLVDSARNQRGERSGCKVHS